MEGEIGLAASGLGFKRDLTEEKHTLSLRLTGGNTFDLDDLKKVLLELGKVEVEEDGENSATAVFNNWVDAFAAMKMLKDPSIVAAGMVEVKWKNDVSVGEIKEFVPNTSVFKGRVGKFTAKFEIQIRNDKKFLVARKIIGPKVEN